MWLLTLAVFFGVVGSGFGGLVHVQVLFRHGDRTPTGTFKSDPNQLSSWPVGWGELTTTGMDELYQQGRRLRQTYMDELKFANPTYKSSETYFRSTSYDRTLQSASSLLTAFYKNSEGTYPAQNPNWPRFYTPVPVHSVPKHEDHLLNIYRDCPRQVELNMRREANPRFVAYLNSQKDYFDYISEKTETPLKHLSDLHHFLDTIYVEKIYNRTLASWITEGVVKRGEAVMSTIDDYGFGLSGFGKPEDVELLKINAGYLLNDVIERMLSAKNATDKPRFVGYSTHDTTILTFLRTLGAKSAVTGGRRLIDYAAMLVIELWEIQGKYFVSMKYSANEKSEFEFHTKSIAGCPNSRFCPLEVFVEQRVKYVVKDPVKECEKVDEYYAEELLL